jgi:hypothetical protein
MEFRAQALRPPQSRVLIGFRMAPLGPLLTCVTSAQMSGLWGWSGLAPDGLPRSPVDPHRTPAGRALILQLCVLKDHPATSNFGCASFTFDNAACPSSIGSRSPAAAQERMFCATRKRLQVVSMLGESDLIAFSKTALKIASSFDEYRTS